MGPILPPLITHSPLVPYYRQCGQQSAIYNCWSVASKLIFEHTINQYKINRTENIFLLGD